MTAEDLMKEYGLTDHVENGSFVERHYPAQEGQRAASGSIYYYVSPDELTKFHKIDCDEYWCYITGSPLEVWQLDLTGKLLIHHLGIQEGCEPLLYLEKGTIFGSRHFRKETEGTFLSCITVPRFSPAGFQLYEQEKILAQYPQVQDFFKMF